MRFKNARNALAALALSVICATAAHADPAQSEHVKVGISRISGYPGVPIAIARGYFAAQGLDAEMIFFDSAQPIAVGVASGDLDFGVSGMSAGFYALAAQGQLRFLASSSRDMAGFYSLVAIAGKKAWDAGLKSPKDLPGHDIAVTQIGTSLHFSIGMIAEKYGFPMSAVTVKPLQSNANVISALTGGTVAAAVLPVSPALPALDKGDVKVLAWMGDVGQTASGAALFTGTKTANERGDMVKRFMIAYRQGMRDFHDAFAGPDNHRRDGPLAPAILQIMADFTHVTPESFYRAIPFADPDGQIDPTGIERQIVWYKSQNLLKVDVDAEDIIDKRYAILTPHRQAAKGKDQ
jgi:NitT/TauT family transport system substrate-binding protein